jgi:3-keto-disaccharide hydrolase
MRRTATLFVVLGVLGIPARAGEEQKKPPEGFSSLFDGKSLSHWKLDDKQKASWKVESGTIHYTGKGGRNLVTAKNYGNFEMYVDWKITKGGDSGVYLRGLPQVQIWDNKEGSGGLYNNPANTPGQKPLVVADNPVGEWNTFYIKMVGDKVTVKLNGKLVVDNAALRYGKKEPPPEGAIELQVHGTPLWFRNVFIKELN